MLYDLVIIGGGPAGLTAGIYAARARLKVCLLERGMPGGLAATTEIIENYPGFPEGIAGPELMAKFHEQAEKLGLEIRSEDVAEVALEGKIKRLQTSSDVLETKSVIIATGSHPKALGVPGEAEFYGQGVSYCATCDGAFFRNREVVVVGGGDAALDEAQFLTRFADRVTVIHRRDEFRAAQISVDRARSNPKIAFRLNAVIESIDGENNVETVVVKDVTNGEISRIKTQGVFVYVGHRPNTDFLKGQIDLTPNGYIRVDARLKTNIPGVYAAGDVRETALRQVATAVGDGAVAAMEAEHYLASL